MDENIQNQYIAILKEELIPALGCTEPIAIAYAAAKARRYLADFHATYWWSAAEILLKM